MKNSNIDLALLLVRVGLALVFVSHGWQKFSDMDSTLQFFSALNLSAFWAYFIATVEVAGGLAMLIGILANWAGLLLAATMLGAIVLVKLSKGFLGGYEFDLMLFLAAIAIALAGSGKYTVRRLWQRA